MEEVKRNPLPQIPVVDLSQCNEEVVAIAVKATEEFGIFQIVNHGIPMELVGRLQEAGRQFFELPETEKNTVGKPLNSRNSQGYSKKSEEDKEGRKAVVDNLVHGLWPPSFVDYSYWPKNPPNYRELNEEFAGYVEKLSENILRWLSEGLGLKKEALKEGFGGDTVEYMMKINYYPPCLDDTGLAIGMNAHTDINILTLVLPSDPGLEVFKDDQWLQVNYIPSAIIVIIGDQIMRLSNGRYKNVLHRAILRKEKTRRMSWAARMKPNYDTLLGSLPELTTGDDNPPKFKPMIYADYKHRSLRHLPLN